jgi:hypothetical protein
MVLSNRCVASCFIVALEVGFGSDLHLGSSYIFPFEVG